MGRSDKIRFYCLYCPKVFEQLKLLIAHYNLNHAPGGQYILRQGKGEDDKVPGLGGEE